MGDPSKPQTPPLLRQLPRELTVMIGFGLGIFGSVATGSAIYSTMVDPTPLQCFLAFSGPIALAFGVYWLVARRIDW